MVCRVNIQSYILLTNVDVVGFEGAQFVCCVVSIVRACVRLFLLFTVDISSIQYTHDRCGWMAYSRTCLTGAFYYDFQETIRSSLVNIADKFESRRPPWEDQMEVVLLAHGCACTQIS